MKYTCCTIAILWLCVYPVMAQKLRPLSIGDPLPDLTLQNIFNSNSKSYDISDAKNKVLILDFFATWCGPCITLLPKLDSIQKKLPETVKVLVVDHESEKQVSEFLKTRASTIQLPFVVRDTILNKLFPHSGIPHEVWIHNGVVKAITPPEEITIENIRKMAAGNNLNLLLKKDIMDFDMNRPFLDNPVIKKHAQLFKSSILTGYIDGLAPLSSTQVDSVRGLRRYYYINLSPHTLYRDATSNIMLPNRWIIEVADKSAFQKELRTSDWVKQHSICYELTLPVETATAERNRIMLSDLNRQFGWRSSIETREIDGWVVFQLEAVSKVLPLQEVNKSLLSLSEFVRRLNLPAVGADIFTLQATDFSFPEKPPSGLSNNIPALKQFLEKYGLGVKKEKIKLPVLVITDDSSPLN